MHAQAEAAPQDGLRRGRAERGAITRLLLASLCMSVVGMFAGCATARTEPLRQSSETASPSPTGSASAPGTETAPPRPPETPGMLSAVGAGAFTTPAGYAFSLDVNWSVHAPATDVGSNPPGQTDIIMASDSGFTGRFTNSTVGGRALPLSVLSIGVNLYGIYDASSIACDSDVLPRSGWDKDFRNGHTCLVKLQTLLSGPRGGGAFDIGTIPNGTPITYGFGDLAESAAGHEGTSWKGVDESRADELAEILGSPLGFALGTEGRLAVTSTSCAYRMNGNVTQHVALLGDFEIPGC